MKTVIFICLVSMVAIAAAEDKYTSRFDNFDVDKVLNNERILTNYIKCLMEEGSCTNEGRELKKTLPDALSSECSKCNDKQKQVSQKVIRFLQDKRPHDWERLTKKYDATGVYRKKLQAKFSGGAEQKKEQQPQPVVASRR
uniref:Chemosensory protein 2 n=1 Tax=Drosicha corpulenta TaxID=535978 RepID=A0A0U3T5N0_9HEMI|nr:chemosensory protein 2 [Drosicha corpulenta]